MSKKKACRCARTEIAFPNEQGTRYTAWILNDDWKRACKNAGVPYVDICNATKHTTMTKYAMDGHSDRVKGNVEEVCPTAGGDAAEDARYGHQMFTKCSQQLTRG